MKDDGEGSYNLLSDLFDHRPYNNYCEVLFFLGILLNSTLKTVN